MTNYLNIVISLPYDPENGEDINETKATGFDLVEKVHESSVNGTIETAWSSDKPSFQAEADTENDEAPF